MRRVMSVVVAMATMLIGVPASAQAEPAELVPVVVQLQPDHPNPEGLARGVTDQFGGSTGFIYLHAVRGFSANLPQAAIDALRRNPQVVAVTPDEVVVSIAATDLDIPTGYDRIEADLAPRTNTITNVDIAVLDTGVRLYHPDLRVYRATDCTVSLFGRCDANGNLEDGHGHGTHVSGIAAALADGAGTTGVASGARIWSVKVLDENGQGLLSWLLAGVDIVTQHAGEIDVANMSLAGQFSDATFDQAITNSVASGVFYAVAAGNSGTDAATFSPANHPDVVAVSAVSDGDGAGGGEGAFACRSGEIDESLASYSNFGAVVDIAAPGTCIYSTWNDDGYRMASGTSMASPHVAGAAALYIAETGRDQNADGKFDGSDVAAVRQALLDNALPQSDACGFGGDSDGFAEPLLWLDGGLLGGSGTCVIADPDSTPPSTPTLTTTADGFSIDVSWSPAEDPESGVLSYLVERDGELVAELDAHTTSYSDGSLSPSTTYTYEVTAKNRQGLLGSPASGSATTSGGDSSVLGWWALDDGSGNTATDDSGWRRHGTLVNGPVWSTGRVGGSLEFDGSDDRVDLDPAVLDGADDVTIAFWVRTSDTGAQSVISGANSGNDNEFHLQFTTDTTLRFWVGTASNEGVEWTIPSVADGQWHHVAVVRNSGPEHTYLYLEGVYYGGWAVTKPMDPLQVAGLVVGQDQDSVGGGFSSAEALHGGLDDLRLFGRVLSDAEIAELADPSANTSPTANDDSATTDEDVPVTVDVVSNDSDPDGDVVTVDSVSQPTSGIASLNVDGTVQYTPDPDFNGIDSFEYSISDGSGGTDTGLVTVTVAAVNDAPIADAGADVSTSVGSTVILDGSGSSDVDGDALTYSWTIASAPDGSTATLSDSTAVAPSLTPDAAGDYVIELVVGDGSVSSIPDTVTVSATDAPNTAPIASDDSYPATEDTVLSVAAPGILGNDSDVDSDPLTVVSNTQTSNGTVTVDADGSFSYAPAADFAGTDSFTYEASDGVATASATVTITVEPVNDPPIAQPDQAGTTEDTAVVISVLANDSDVDGDTLTVADLTSPNSGVAVANADGTVTYTPGPDFHGTDSFTYTANDGTTDSAPVTVDVSVTPVNDAPVADAGVDVAATVGTTVTLDGSASFDVDGDALAYSWEITAAPADSTVTLSDPTAVSPSFTADLAGTYEVALTVSDGSFSDTDTTIVSATEVSTLAQYATSETSVSGSVSGDLNATYVSDDTFETLSEEQSGGRPQLRTSSLDHRWTFDLVPGDAVTLIVEGHHSASDETFSVEYSTDGGTSFQHVFQLGATESVLAASLPATTAGTVIVRVVDAAPTAGEAIDSVAIDLLVIETTNPQTGDGGAGGGEVFTAASESTVYGSVLGDLSALGQADGTTEVIAEELYAGGKRSRLEHHWTFETTSTGLVLHVVAGRSDPVAEALTLEYSTDGTTWNNLTVALDGTAQTVTMPTSLTGTIHIRVVDTDRSRDESTIDTTWLDALYFEAPA